MEETAGQSLAATSKTIGSLAQGVGGAVVPPAAVANSLSLLLTRTETLLTKVESVVQSDVLKSKGYIEKYWPIVAGALIALTRLLH